MTARVISAERSSRLLAACEELLPRLQTAATALNLRATTGTPGVFANIAGDPQYDRLVADVRLLVAVACVAPARMAARLDSLAAAFDPPTLRVLFSSAAHEVRGDDP
jgi:hypothetical protein